MPKNLFRRNLLLKLNADLGSLRADCRGTAAVMMALLMVPMIGMLGLGFEISNWYMSKRAMQNAADAAAIAAASNASSNYDVEAKAVAALYGYVDGQNNVTVTASNAATCPDGSNTCYSVTITSLDPLSLSQVVGFSGTTTVNGVKQTALSSTAIAQQSTAPTQLCLLALASSGAQGIRTNGAPKANMANCNVMSNTTATCNGHDLGATNGYAVGTNDGCGINQYSDTQAASDPYVGLASNIPAPSNLADASHCNSSYPQEPAKKKDPALPASNQWSGTKALTGTASVAGNTLVCGDLQLTGDVTINTSSNGAVLFIDNGQLDTNGYTLSTSNGSALTVVFTGTNASYTHGPTGGGTLNFNAPDATSNSPWSGVAIYQDPSLTSGVDISAAGNSPTWDLTGLVYLPHSSVTFSGAVNKSNNGYSCFVMVMDNITVNGTGSILDTGQCDQAGLTMPTAMVPSRGKLVY